MTNNPRKRIRQHNGEIEGGAKATRNKGPWCFISYMSGFPNESSAM